MWVLERLAVVEADLHEVYGIDLGDPDVLHRRTWVWFTRRVQGLFDLPPTLTLGRQPVQATRIGRLRYPTPPAK